MKVSKFGDQYRGPFSRMLSQLGDTVTYTAVDGTSTTISAIFNEQVGAIDPLGRAVFHISTLASNGIDLPEEGATIQISGESAIWIVVDVRDSKDDSAELRCDRSKPEVN